MPRFTRAAGYTLPAPDESVLYARFSDVLRQALAKNYDRLDDVLAGMKPKKRKARR